MISSSFSCIIATNELLELFNDVDLATFKTGLMEQFGCENEKEFLQKILTFSQSHLSLKTLNNIHKLAINISNKSQYPVKKRKTINCLSSLPSNLIECIGKYLTIKLKNV